MAEAFWWGLLAGSSLILGGLLSLWFRLADRWIGHIMAFGGGVLISAVAFELVEEGIRTAGGIRAVAAGLFAGSLVFYFGDTLIDRLGGADRKRMDPATDRPAHGVAGLAIVLGIVLDGIPESIVIGLTLLEGGEIGVAIVVAVFLSNLPEAIAATTGLRGSGWSRDPHHGPVGAGHAGVRRGRGRWLRAVRHRRARHDRLRPRICGRGDPHDARGHDDARGV